MQRLRKKPLDYICLAHTEINGYPKFRNIKKRKIITSLINLQILEDAKLQTPLGYGINQAKRWLNTRFNWW